MPSEDPSELIDLAIMAMLRQLLVFEKAMLAAKGIAVTWMETAKGFDVYHNNTYAYDMQKEDTRLIQKVYQSQVGRIDRMEKLWITMEQTPYSSNGQLLRKGNP